MNVRDELRLRLGAADLLIRAFDADDLRERTRLISSAKDIVEATNRVTRAVASGDYDATSALLDLRAERGRAC